MIAPKKRRLRKPTLKEGELRVYWGRVDRGEEPSLVYAWQGDRTMKRDTSYLAREFEGLLDPTDCIAKELERRGYDLTTLKFSIMKKGAPSA